MQDKIKFMEMLKDLTEIARTQENLLTKEEIKEYFKEMELAEEHYNHIFAYLGENKVKVAGFDYQAPKAEQSESEEEELNQQDSVYLKMYLKDLKLLKKYSKEEVEDLYGRARKGEEGAKEQLIHSWLPKVVTIAKKYKNQGVLLEDLIQEGNIGLLDGIESFLNMEEKTEGDKYIKNSITVTIEDLIEEYRSEDDLENTVLGKSNLLNEASNYLAEDLGRVATIEELAEYTKLSVEEIKDMLMLSLDGLKVGKGE